MHWKQKALMQNAISLLPSSASYAAYYWMQRHFGGWRQVNPIGTLTDGVEAWRRIVSRGRNPAGGIFLEVGTGGLPLIPMANWLMGAQKTITLDLNPYLKGELIAECLQFVRHNRDEIKSVFHGFLDKSRFSDLIAYIEDGRFSVRSFLDLCGIDYRAPTNAASTGLADGSVDFHTSHNVLEHIPPAVLRAILHEGVRVLKDSGLLVHRVDYSDHFSHSDPGISAINFLQYSERTWRLLAENRYMYMNRLRHDDFIALFGALPLRTVEAEPESDARSRELLESGRLRVHKSFSAKSVDTLAITASWIISAKST